MVKEPTPLNGHVHIKVWEKQADGTEKVVKDDLIKNLVVTAGKDSLMKFISNISGVGIIQDIGVGDSTTAAAVGFLRPEGGGGGPCRTPYSPRDAK